MECRFIGQLQERPGKLYRQGLGLDRLENASAEEVRESHETRDAAGGWRGAESCFSPTFGALWSTAVPRRELRRLLTSTATPSRQSSATTCGRKCRGQLRLLPVCNGVNMLTTERRLCRDHEVPLVQIIQPLPFRNSLLLGLICKQCRVYILFQYIIHTTNWCVFVTMGYDMCQSRNACVQSCWNTCVNKLMQLNTIPG